MMWYLFRWHKRTQLDVRVPNGYLSRSGSSGTADGA